MQHVQVSIDVLVTADVLPFWPAVLGYISDANTDERAVGGARPASPGRLALRD